MWAAIKQANDGINEKLSRRRVVLCGNPNVGKSTVFNALTKMRQHTGNWPGKTVELASGTCLYKDTLIELVDLPGTYSLFPHSQEESISAQCLMEKAFDLCVIVCDATLLRRNLHLVFQVLELGIPCMIVLNLIDEAKRRQIKIDTQRLASLLGCEVVAASATHKKSLQALKQAIAEHPLHKNTFSLPYRKEVEEELQVLEVHYPSRFEALAALCDEKSRDPKVLVSQKRLKDKQVGNGYDLVAAAYQEKATQILLQTEQKTDKLPLSKFDRLATHRVYGILLMLVMLFVVFWITMEGANLPSAWLSALFRELEAVLLAGCEKVHMPWLWQSFLVQGIFRTVGWVVSVMLPPMLIFFPLFTFLEDLGYLPRVAFQLDGAFAKSGACGKQALTMCMGFGCNAVGVSGARIIDGRKERELAILTNAFVPCNGRFPTLIALIMIFFTTMRHTWIDSVLAALFLCLFILLSIAVTLVINRILSRTLYRDTPASFALELPPYRRPQLLQILVRSFCDRTLKVLGRAVAAAFFGGIFLWVLSNVMVEQQSLFQAAANWLDPFAHLLGMDGVILLAFFLGFPANEIVLPIVMMGYTASGVMMELGSFTLLRELFIANGWTWISALCVMLFSLFHFPCATTLMTIYRESGSKRLTVLAFFIPLCIGVLLCIGVHLLASL